MPWGYALVAAGTVGSAAISSNATNKAAGATTSAANTATAEAGRQFNISRVDQQPWLTTGGSALNKLAGMYQLDTFTPTPPGTQPGSATGTPGGNPTLAQANPTIQPGFGGGSTPGVLAAQAGGPHSDNNTADLLMWGGVNPFKKNATPIQDIAAAMRNGTPITDAQWQQAGYGPGGAAPGGGAPQPSGTFTPGGSQPGVDPYADFYKSPDYAFRLSQGLGALDAGAASRGSLDSGATRKAEIKFGSNIAAGGFNDYAARLANLAGLGQTTATNLAGQGAQYAGQVGANARWAGDNMASSYTKNGANYAGTVRDLAGIGQGLIQNTGNNYTPAGGGMYNGGYLAPFNSAAAGQGF